MKMIAPQMWCSRQYCSTLRALRAVADHDQPAGHRPLHALEDADDVEHPLDRTEVRDVDQQLLARLAPSGAPRGRCGPRS